MRIIELRIKGFRRISAVSIRPNGAIVPITGMNDAGKTSVLSAIWTVLGSKAVAPAKPIKAGQEEAVISCDLGEYKVTRTFKRSEGVNYTMDLKITERDGTPVRRKQQEVLDSLIGAIAFDPLAFARAQTKDQFDLMKRLVPGYDFEAKAAERKRLFDLRTAANRQAKEHTTLAERVELPPGACPAPIDVAAKITQLRQATTANEDIDRTRATRTGMAEEAQRKADEAERLQAQAAVLEREAQEIRDAIAEMPPLPTRVDTTALAEEIGRAQEVDAVRALHTSRQHHEDQAEAFDSQAADLTRQIEALDEEKVKAVGAAQIPIKGLSFGDNEILFDGLPFEQAGTATKIKTSVAIGIMLNPKLRVMTIDEGSELDSKSMELLADLAEKNDYQIWLARIDESGAGEFVIEDGHLAEKG